MTRPFIKSASSARSSRGIVLVVAMFLLIVLSLIAVTSIRTTSSMELSVNNTRSQALAMQAAEAALRYCEKGAINQMNGLTAPVLVFVPDAAPMTPTTEFHWQDYRNWDRAISPTTPPNITTLAPELLNNRADGRVLYKRMPECTAQFQIAGQKRAVITARGFGPEVAAADTDRHAPVGAEVWLQSVIQLD